MSTLPETTPTPASNLPPLLRGLPGDLAMWFFILAELTVFGICIIAFTVTQALKLELFQESRALLDTSTGLALTLGLLTSGLLAALAVEAVKAGRNRQGTALLWAAQLTAGLYVFLKLREYSHLLSAGLDMEHNTFFTLYWILTAFHFLHVLLGMVILAFVGWRCWHGAYTAEKNSGLVSGVLYWHMVDLVWVVLFPLVYVLN